MRMDLMKPGMEAVIEKMDRENPILKGLLRMGFFDGAKVWVLFRNCTNSLLMFQIDNSLIALRTEDCKTVDVQTKKDCKT